MQAVMASDPNPTLADKLATAIADGILKAEDNEDAVNVPISEAQPD